MKLTFQWLRTNLTGISTPFLGLSWTPPASERDAIRKLLIYLEDRRALYLSRYGYQHSGRSEHLTESVLDIRRTLTATLQSVDFQSETKQLLESMRVACRSFLDDTPRIVRSSEENRKTAVSSTNMRPLQKAMATSIASLAILYQLDLEENLSNLVSSVL